MLQAMKCTETLSISLLGDLSLQKKKNKKNPTTPPPQKSPHNRQTHRTKHHSFDLYPSHTTRCLLWSFGYFSRLFQLSPAPFFLFFLCCREAEVAAAAGISVFLGTVHAGR